MIRLLPLLAAGCGDSLQAIDPQAPCREAGYAIARRTLECTGDADLANARYDAFAADYDCKSVEYAQDNPANEDLIPLEDQPGNYFHCAFAIGELACELVASYGDDLDQWLTASPACALVVEGLDP